MKNTSHGCPYCRTALCLWEKAASLYLPVHVHELGAVRHFSSVHTSKIEVGMPTKIEWFFAVLGTCVGLLVTVVIRGQVDSQSREIKLLRASNSKLRAKLARLEQLSASAAPPPLARPCGTDGSSAGRSAGSSAGAIVREELSAAVDVHGHWDWSILVHELLLPFDQVTEHMLEAAVRTCDDNGTMYCLRAQVIGGHLYITDYRAIFYDRYYAPSRVLPLLETLRRHPNLPDVDLVVAAVDEPRIKTLVTPKYWSRLCTAYPGTARPKAAGETRRPDADLPPPLFSSTISRHHLDLPWLDFSFFMPRKDHKLRTPPWKILHPQMLAQVIAI